MNKNAIEGKVIFLTGAGSGIGRATALKLSKLGARLALSDLNIESCRETAKQCAGGPHQVTLLNVSEYKRCIETIKDAIGYFGRIDHVFNCAGINPTARDLVDCSEDYFDKLVAVNLKGVYNVTKATIPYLRSGSAIVNVSSICGIHPHKQMAIYCATKYAIIGFSKSMALELGPKGIRVNVVAPGYIETPTNASVVAGEEALKKTVEQVALGRMGKAGEVADVVAFLMGDESRYMNGSVVEVNGVGVLFLCHLFGRSFVSILFLLTELRSRAKKEEVSTVLQDESNTQKFFNANNNPVLGCGCHNSKEAYQNLEGSLMNRRKVQTAQLIPASQMRKETSTPALPTFSLSLLISISSH
ncbi:NAD(P)-binding protein [Aureobasidium pullulans]|nr:NAD(P)-binding protein [Aureobasidium pullulans]